VGIANDKKEKARTPGNIHSNNPKEVITSRHRVRPNELFRAKRMAATRCEKEAERLDSFVSTVAVTKGSNISGSR
jgi:hypothetical protein